MSRNNSLSLVSIGMPIYNEARFLERTLQCFVSQDYPNIELLISDNASDDGSDLIAKKYALQFNWIKYHCFEQNQGPAPNFEYVLEQANGKYFMWAAGHDLWVPNYLRDCVQMLEERPNAVIAFGTSSWIDGEDDAFDREFGWTDTRGMGRIERFSTIFWGNMHPFLGMFRTELIKECPIVHTVGADLLILVRLALIGDFVHAVDAGWSRREFRVERTHAEKLVRYNSKDRGFSLSVLSQVFPLFRLPFELVRVVLNSKCSVLEKTLLICMLVPSLPARYLAGKRKIQ